MRLLFRQSGRNACLESARSGDTQFRRFRVSSSEAARSGRLFLARLRCAPRARTNDAKYSPAFLAAAFGAACVPSSAGQTIGEYARKRTRACGRRRLRTELVRTAVRSRQGFAAARAQARLRASRRKAAGVAGAAGRFGCLGRGRLPADFSGWRSAGALAADPGFPGGRAAGFSGECLPCGFGGKHAADTARLQKRQLTVAPETAQKNQHAPLVQKGAARRAIQGCFVPLGPRFGRLRAASAAEERFPAGKRALF